MVLDRKREGDLRSHVWGKVCAETFDASLLEQGLGLRPGGDVGVTSPLFDALSVPRWRCS